MDIDTDSNDMCVAGAVEQFDRLALPLNKRVTFSYVSNGSIGGGTPRKVRGEFVALFLTLEIIPINGAEPDYSATIPVDCKIIKGNLLKRGERGKVNLLCDLGENLSDFPGLTEDLVASVDNAFGERNRAKVNTKKGRLKITHDGRPSEDEPPVTCSLSTPG